MTILLIGEKQFSLLTLLKTFLPRVAHSENLLQIGANAVLFNDKILLGKVAENWRKKAGFLAFRFLKHSFNF